jgi:isopentenyl-diphosphate delta-isomerase
MEAVSEKLEVINEQGNVVGVESREKVHHEGLLHREINVWFYTPQGEIIFQRRGSHKDTYPNLLCATVGGHLDVGDTHIDAAIREVTEETGIVLTEADLVEVGHWRGRGYDPVTGNTNYADKKIYACRFDGPLAKLRVEDDSAQGFVLWPIDRLLVLDPSDQSDFVPNIFSEPMIDIFHKIKGMI